MYLLNLQVDPVRNICWLRDIITPPWPKYLQFLQATNSSKHEITIVLCWESLPSGFVDNKSASRFFSFMGTVVKAYAFKHSFQKELNVLWEMTSAGTKQCSSSGIGMVSKNATEEGGT